MASSINNLFKPQKIYEVMDIECVEKGEHKISEHFALENLGKGTKVYNVDKNPTKIYFNDPTDKR